MASGSAQVTPLGVLVQHLPCLTRTTQQLLVCKLLCTSDAVAALVAKHCRGKLCITFTSYTLERVKAFTPWLSRHGCLLSSLNLELNLTASCWQQAEAAVGAALQQASSSSAAAWGRGKPAGCAGAWCSPPGLQLQHYCSHPAVAGAVLDQLDSWYLTRLDLGRHAGYSCGFVLEQLTNLSRLSLHEDTADVLLPSVSPLSRLTRLALVDVAASSMAKLKWLPAQLLELQLSLARLRRTEQLPPGVQLGHLTCLTKLSNGDGKPLLVQSGDVLPVTLRTLAVRDVLDVAPLLALTHLCRLSSCASTTRAQQLKQLAASTAGGSSSSSSSSRSVSGGSGGKLQSVALCYSDMEAAAAAAASWPLLPLDRLELRATEGTLPAHTCHTLGALTGLRVLQVYGGGCGGCTEAAVVQATQAELARALAAMTCLEVLGLRGFGLLPELVASEQGINRSCAPSAAAAAAAAAAAVSDDTGQQQGSGWYPDTTFDDVLCVTASHLSLSSSNDSTCSCSCSSRHITLSDSSRCSSGGTYGTIPSVSPSCLCAVSLSPLVLAVSNLPQLVCLSVCSVRCGGVALQLDAAAASVLAGACGLTSLQLSDVGLTNDAVDALLRGGLTQLRRLVLDNNMALTAAMLPDDVAATCTQLRELGVLRTGIRADAAAFKGRILRLNPHVAIKSSAR